VRPRSSSTPIIPSARLELTIDAASLADAQPKQFAQSGFGIRPLRKAGGAIVVHDGVTVDFQTVFVAAPPRSRARRPPAR